MTTKELLDRLRPLQNQSFLNYPCTLPAKLFAGNKVGMVSIDSRSALKELFLLPYAKRCENLLDIIEQLAKLKLIISYYLYYALNLDSTWCESITLIRFQLARIFFIQDTHEQIIDEDGVKTYANLIVRDLPKLSAFEYLPIDPSNERKGKLLIYKAEKQQALTAALTLKIVQELISVVWYDRHGEIILTQLLENITPPAHTHQITELKEKYGLADFPPGETFQTLQAFEYLTKLRVFLGFNPDYRSMPIACIHINHLGQVISTTNALYGNNQSKQYTLKVGLSNLIAYHLKTKKFLIYEDHVLTIHSETIKNFLETLQGISKAEYIQLLQELMADPYINTIIKILIASPQFEFFKKQKRKYTTSPDVAYEQLANPYLISQIEPFSQIQPSLLPSNFISGLSREEELDEPANKQQRTNFDQESSSSQASSNVLTTARTTDDFFNLPQPTQSDSSISEQEIDYMTAWLVSDSLAQDSLASTPVHAVNVSEPKVNTFNSVAIFSSNISPVYRNLSSGQDSNLLTSDHSLRSNPYQESGLTLFTANANLDQNTWAQEDTNPKDKLSINFLTNI